MNTEYRKVTEEQWTEFLTSLMRKAKRLDLNSDRLQRIIENPLFRQWFQNTTNGGKDFPGWEVDVSSYIDSPMEGWESVWQVIPTRSFGNFKLLDLYLNAWRPPLDTGVRPEDCGSAIFSHLFNVPFSMEEYAKCHTMDPSLCGEGELQWLQFNWSLFPSCFRDWASGKCFIGARGTVRRKCGTMYFPYLHGTLCDAKIHYVPIDSFQKARDWIVLHG